MSAAARGSEIWATMPHSSGNRGGTALSGLGQPPLAPVAGACHAPTVFQRSHPCPKGLAERPLHPGAPSGPPPPAMSSCPKGSAEPSSVQL